MFFKDKRKLMTLPVERIQPNPSQPRKTFDREELEALAQRFPPLSQTAHRRTARCWPF